jgi:hypothetical protein
MRAIEIGRATSEDLPGILSLQEANHIARLSAEECRGGFLSARFSMAQFAAFASDLGIVVAREKERIIGFMCASRHDFDSGSPIVESMLAGLEGLSLGGRELSRDRICIYGPVCIAADQRGRGVLRRLFHALKAELAGKCANGAAFIARNNPHSFDAHVHGLGMVKIGSFAHGGKMYDIVAFGI